MRRTNVVRLALLALAATAVALVAGSQGSGQGATRAEAVAWQGLVGEPRTEVALGQRFIVVLEYASLADRVAAVGGLASDRQERAWTRRALAAQKLFVSRMTLQGARILPEFQYTRVLNGFSAPLDAATVALLERAPEVRGVYPVRAAFPAAVSTRVLARRAFAPGAGRRLPVALPGFDGRGVTVALLDTGVDRAQPYLGGSVLDGIDVLGGSEGALAAPRPDNGAELERHGTALAGIVAGAGGPWGLAGVAIGASILPVRVAGWQQDATGQWAVFSRSDQVIAGLERAVDPNADGDAHDAARIALVGVAEPFAAFADGPAARAAAGALALDTLVVAPAGNDGPAGPGFGNVAGPGGAPAALTVGAADLRERYERARLVVRTGLKTLLDRVVPLGGAVPPASPLQLELGMPDVFAPASPPAEQAATLELADFFDRAGFSRVAGRAALVPGGQDSARVVRDAARAGAAAVLLFGAPLPPGALGLDESVPIPVVGVPAGLARELLDARRSGADIGISLGPVPSAAAPTAGSVAAFSSRGLAFDGRVKPELVSYGVGVATSEPGANEFRTINGSSAAAAVVAGEAALLAQARPQLDARELKSLLVGAARPLDGEGVTAQGSGVADVGAAAAAELAALPAALAFERARGEDWNSRRAVRVRNLSTRTLRIRVRVDRAGFPAAETTVTARPAALQLRPGQEATVRVEARVAEPAGGGPPAEGALELVPRGGGAIRVPFAIAFGPTRQQLLGEVELSERAFAPSDTRPAVLTIQAGAVRTVGGEDEVQPVARLDLELFATDGKRIGVIGRLRNILPGRYAFAITGRDPAGQALKVGPHRLRVVAYPVGGGRASVRNVPFTVK
jgi:Subtilase family